MLVEAPLGNISNLSSELPFDWLDLAWEECFRRAVRKQTRSGRLIRTLLKLGTILRYGDVLIQDSQGVVAVNVVPCEVVVVEPKNTSEMASLAYKLGDLHVPMEISETEIITPCDGPIQAAFHELSVEYRTETRRFQPTLRSTTVQMTLATDFELLHTR